MQFEDSFFGRPETIRVYKSLFKTHIKTFIKDEQIPNWSDQQTNAMLNLWLKRNLQPRTISTLLHLLRDYIEFKNGPIIKTKHLFRKINRIKQEEEKLVLNKDQATLMIKKCKEIDKDFLPILLLGLHGGLRKGEIFGLKYDDIDEKNNKLRIKSSYDGPTKSGRTRYLNMSRTLSKEMITLKHKTKDKDKPLLRGIGTISWRLRRLCRLANAPLIHFHDLRHTFATLALEAGRSPKEVQEWLGHASLSTTLNIYWNSIPRPKPDLSFLPGERQRRKKNE